MKRLMVALMVAVSLLTGTAAACLAGPPSFDQKCEEAETKSAGKKPFTCDYED